MPNALSKTTQYFYPNVPINQGLVIKVIFDISGMRCGACAVGIELSLTKKKRIKSAKVSLNERMAVVEYDPAILGASDIAKTVNDLGYIVTARR